MRPSLFELFGEPLPAYFTFLLIGFAVAIWLGARGATKQGLDREVYIDLGIYSIIMGVLGGRLLHVFADGYFWDYVHLCTDPSLVSWPVPRGECAAIGGAWDGIANVCRPVERDCFAWAEFWNGGLTYYGGLIAAVAFGAYYLRKHSFPVGKGLDLAGAGLPIGLFFGRIGCFLGGCCFGQPYDGPLSVSFPPGSLASMTQAHEHLLASSSLPSLPVHPTQLYEAAGCLVIALFVFLVVEPRKRFDGQVMLFVLVTYSILRFGLEFLRADARGGGLGLSTSQLVSVVVVIGCAFVYRHLKATALAAPPAAHL